MLKAVALLTRRKDTKPFKDYYTMWFNTLKNTLLPSLRRSMHSSTPTLLATQVELLHHHLQSYYHALDLAASDDVAQILFPDWRNSLEKPFLFLADFHPYLFTNLLRSFLNDNDEDEYDAHDQKGTSKIDGSFTAADIGIFSNKPWQIAMAWKNPSRNILARIEQIDSGLRLMVPSLVDRARNAQVRFLEHVAEDWIKCEGKKEAVRAGIGEASVDQVDQMVSVVLDANRMRRSVLAEIIGVTSVYQAALFLEGLAQFLVGFRDSELIGEFERCSLPLDGRPFHLGI